MNRKASISLLVSCAVVLGLAAVWLFTAVGGDDQQGVSDTSGVARRAAGATAVAPARSPLPSKVYATAEESGARRDPVLPEDGAATRVLLSGRVLGPEGSPAADRVVVFTPSGRFDFEILVEVGYRPWRDSVDRTTVRTDDEGRFALYMDPGQEGLLTMAEDSDLLFEAERGIAVPVPGYRSDRDLGDLTVRPAARLGGTVHDAAGVPVAGARIELAKTGLLSLPMPLERGATDAAGRFSFRGLEAGELVLRVSAPGHVPSQRVVSLEPGQEILDVAVELRSGSAIGGTVIDDRGVPVAGAKVVSQRKRALGPGLSLDHVDSDEAIDTDARGRFLLAGIEGDSATVQVWAQGHERATRENVPVGATNLVVEIGRLVTVSGVLLAPTGEPIAGSKVHVRQVGSERGRAGSFTASIQFGGRRHIEAFHGRRVETDDDGRFTLDSVEPGNLVVVAEGRSHLTAESHVLQLRAGQLLDGIRLVAEPGASLEVLVVDGTGEPIEGATVTVREPGTRAPRSLDVALANPGDSRAAPFVWGPSAHLGGGVTGADGIAVIGGLRVGLAEIVAGHDAFVLAQPVSVTLERDTTARARIVLSPAGFVELTVEDVTGAPAAEVRYLVEGPLATAETRQERGRTDGEGTARIGPLGPGRYRARLLLPPQPFELGGGTVFLPGRDDAIEGTETEIAVTAGGSAPVRLVMPVLTALSGTVRDAGGPVAGARVRILKDQSTFDSSMGLAPTVRTDEHGGYRFDCLAAGEYVLEFGREGALVMHRAELSIPPTVPEATRDLRMRGGTVRVAVVDADAGTPVEGARVGIDRMLALRAESQRRPGFAPAAEQHARTDRDGIALLEDIPPGDYRLEIRHESHGPENIEDVVVTADGSTDAGTVRLRAGGSLLVRVEGLQELEVAVVEIEPLDGSSGARTERVVNGELEVENLAPGRYRVRARPMVGEEEWGLAREVEVRAKTQAQVRLSAGQ